MFQATTPLSWLNEVGVTGCIDIAVMTALLYSILIWMKRTRRAASVLGGILIIAVVYLLAKQFNLFLTAAVFQGFFAIIVVALVVIFQEELRYFFEKVAHWGRVPLANRKNEAGMPRRTEILAKTLFDLARDKIGALIVLRGRDLLVRHLDGGNDLRGRLSEEILKSIFDPHSSGHDGAVIIEGDTINSFACHLPLSKNHAKLSQRGTRHAAALGLAERTDALCLVVSEERGSVSAARHGDIQEVRDHLELADIIEAFNRDIHSEHFPMSRANLLKKNSREKLLAFGLSLALWFVLVHESHTIFKTYTVMVEPPMVPDALSLSALDPKDIQVTFSGPRKSFYFLNPSDIRLALKPWAFEEGHKTVNLSDSELTYPKDLTVESMTPGHVLVTLNRKNSPPGKPE
jgi:diadenylate cyclase